MQRFSFCERTSKNCNMANKSVNGIRTSLVQCKVLLKKNWWLAIRNWRITLIQLASPIAFVVVLFLLQLLYTNVQNDLGKDPVPIPLSNVPKCKKNNLPCVSILFTPSRGQYKEIDTIIDYIANLNGLSVSDEQIDAIYPQTITHDIYSIKNPENMTRFIFKYPNVTQAGMFVL
jgi:hypothetical protein